MCDLFGRQLQWRLSCEADYSGGWCMCESCVTCFSVAAATSDVTITEVVALPFHLILHVCVFRIRESSLGIGRVRCAMEKVHIGSCCGS